MCFRTICFKPITKTLMLISVSLFCVFSETVAQRGIDYTLYANIIYRFTKYINWPNEKKTGDFVLGIIGDSPLYNELKAFVGNKTVGAQKIVVKKIPSSASSYDCQMLFICEDESKSIKRIAALTEDAPVLIVSESDGLARKGSCINFIVVDEHLRLEINKTNIEQRNLSVASDLLSLGIIVK